MGDIIRETTMEKYSFEIKEIRRSLGYTQKQFAKYLELHWRTISSWECGVREPKPITFNYLKSLKKKGGTKMFKLNKKGWMPTMIVLTTWMLGGGIIAAALTFPQHRIKRANEKCVAVESLTAEQCASVVAGMDKKEVLDYIRDDEVPEPINYAG